jgi:hypothetical protein
VAIYSDGTVQSIALALPDFQRIARGLVKRDLSPDEWPDALLDSEGIRVDFRAR